MLVKTRGRRRAALISALCIGTLAFAAGAADAATVATARLDWTQTPKTTSPRNLLGYVQTIGQISGGGSVSPTAPATGPTVTSTAASGLGPFTWQFPTPTTGAGTVDETGAADVELRGTLTYLAHGTALTFTVVDPRVVLNGGAPDGTDGAIYASGEQPTDEEGNGGGPYTRAEPLFFLDLRTAQVAHTGGVISITGIVPTLNQDAFPNLSGFNANGGSTDWGTFALAITPGTGDPEDPGDPGEGGEPASGDVSVSATAAELTDAATLTVSTPSITFPDTIRESSSSRAYDSQAITYSYSVTGGPWCLTAQGSTGASGAAALAKVGSPSVLLPPLSIIHQLGSASPTTSALLTTPTSLEAAPGATCAPRSTPDATTYNASDSLRFTLPASTAVEAGTYGTTLTYTVAREP